MITVNRPTQRWAASSSISITIDKSEHTFYNNTVHLFHEAAIDSLLKSPIGDDL